MNASGNPLLRPGSEAEWARIDADQRRSPRRSGETIEQRLMRGQRLSAQAAALRRAVREASAALSSHLGDRPLPVVPIPGLDDDGASIT